jgi:hypothetical protein
MIETSIREAQGKPAAGAPLAVPSFVGVDGDHLVTGYDLTAAQPAVVEVAVGTIAASHVLDAFLSVGWDAAKVQRVAEAWGPLGLCAHGLPAEHSRAAPGWLGETPFPGCVPLGSDDGAFASTMRQRFNAPRVSVWAREPLERWFDLSTRLDAALCVITGAPASNACLLWPGVGADAQPRIALQTINAMLSVSAIHPELFEDRGAGLMARTGAGPRRLRGTLTSEQPEPFPHISRLTINAFPGGGLLAVVALQAVNMAVTGPSSDANGHHSTWPR